MVYLTCGGGNVAQILWQSASVVLRRIVKKVTELGCASIPIR